MVLSEWGSASEDCGGFGACRRRTFTLRGIDARGGWIHGVGVGRGHWARSLGAVVSSAGFVRYLYVCMVQSTRRSSTPFGFQ
jgi:hypothetical protein